MSLHKAILHGKEHRKEYTGGKAVDKSCRNHGGCDWCKNNRLHKFVKQGLTDDWENEPIESEAGDIK